MKTGYRFFPVFLCALLSLILICTLVSLPLSLSAEESVQAAYSFDASADLAADEGGEYPLSTKEFGAGELKAGEGYLNGGMTGYVNLSPSFFGKQDQFSLGFWVNYTKAEASSKRTLLLVSGKNKASLELGFVSSGDMVNLQLKVSDGGDPVTLSYDVSQILTEEKKWNHIAFTYRITGNKDKVSVLYLYVNGKTSSTSVSAKLIDLTAFECTSAAFHGVRMDELYYADVQLSSNKVSTLMGGSAAAFYREQKTESGSDTSGSSSDLPPVTVDRHNYSWAAYLFDGTFAAGTDFHDGDIPASVDPSCALIDTDKLSAKYGKAVIRREGTAPTAYLTLDNRLFNGQSSFTFSAWVYRSGKDRKNTEYLLDLQGSSHVLRFAPYAGDENGYAPFLEFTDQRGNVDRQSLKSESSADPRNRWVHYAVTISQSGEIKVYTNGLLTATFASGVKPAAVAYSQCRVLTGASSSDSTRTAVDEVYVTPKALSDVEIRKIQFYGLTEYTSKVLPPVDSTAGGDDPSNPLAPNAVDIAEDNYNQTAVIAGGFVGTTFDSRSGVGFDWNNSANATVTGGRLTQGISSYGLALDGASFVRYPGGILDGMQELTLSLSYTWSGPGEGETRSQRIFDFSRKASSVSAPEAYLFLEAGNGISGLRFGLSDGVSSTFLTCDYNAVNTWTRVTVTVADGKITLYLDDKVAATGYTEVDLSSICPNFCYLGRSGVKGDPMFVGAVDEVYISPLALEADRVSLYLNGLTEAIEGPGAAVGDFWGILIKVIIVIAVLLVLGIVAVIIVVIAKKDKKSPEDEAPLPVSITKVDGTVIGPRAARRLRAEAESGNGTVTFRKVDLEQSSTSPEENGTVTFPKVGEKNPDALPEENNATVSFRKITDETKENR